MARHFITRLTTAQRTAGTAAVGELVFDTDLNQYFQGTASAGPNNWGMLAAESIASVVQYSPSTTYAVNEIVRDSMGLLYVSLVASNIGNALSDTNSWLAVGGTGGVAIQDEGTALTTQADTINFTGAGVTATGTAGTKTVDIPGPQSLTGVAVRQLDALPKQAEYDYTVDPASTDVDLDSSEDFLNSLGFNLVFNNNRVIAANTTFYLYNTPPSPLTNATAEPDIILTYPNFGYNNMNLSNNRNSFIFIVEKGEGILSEFLIANDLPNVNLQQTITFDGVSYNGNTLFSTLYTRAASDTGTEVLTYNRADGSIDWRVSAAGTGDITAVNTAGNSGLQGGVTSGAANLSLTNTGVTAAAYANANVTVDAQGRITEISAGTLPNAPAINYNSGNPTLQSPVTAEQIRNLIGAGTPSGVQSGATFPTSPTVGMIFVLTADIAGPPAFESGVYLRTPLGDWQPLEIDSINTIGPPGVAVEQTRSKIVYTEQSNSFWISDGTNWHLMTVVLGNPDFTTGDEVAFDTRVADVRTRLVATVSNTYEDVRIEAPAMGDPIPTAGFSLAPETNSSNQVAFITIGLPNNTLSTAFMNSLAVGDRIVTATEGRDNRTFGIIASASDLNTANRTVRLTLECAATPNGFILAPFPPGIPFPDVTNVTAILGRANDIRPAERTLGALPDVSITADNTHFTAQTGGTTSVTNLMGDGDYIIATRVLELIFVSASDRAPYVEGTNVAFTASTVAQADIPTNILFTGAVTSSRTDGNLGEVVEITVDQRYETFFDQFNLAQGSTTERAISGATVGGWRAWNFVSDDVGVAVFNAHGDLFNQSISDFTPRVGGTPRVATLPSTMGSIGELVSTTGPTVDVVPGSPEVITFQDTVVNIQSGIGSNGTTSNSSLYAALPLASGTGTVTNSTGSFAFNFTANSVSSFMTNFASELQTMLPTLFPGAAAFTVTSEVDATNVRLILTATSNGDLPQASIVTGTANARGFFLGFTQPGGFSYLGDDQTISIVDGVTGSSNGVFPSGLYRRTTNSGTIADWTPVDSLDRITFSTGEDTGETASHTFTGVTTTLGGQSGTDPNIATFTFASQDDAFAFFALTGGEANNGTSTRSLTVVYGATTLVFPVGTLLGPGGGATLDVLNRSVVTGGLVAQSTPTSFVVDATADIPVHATGTRFNLVGAGTVDVDIDPATDTITFTGAPGAGGGLDDLSDVDITGEANGQILQYDGTRWLNRTADRVVDRTTLRTHSDVSSVLPTMNQVLKWNGTMWAPAADETAAGSTGLVSAIWQGENSGIVSAPAPLNTTATETPLTIGQTHTFGTALNPLSSLPAGTYRFTLTMVPTGLTGTTDGRTGFSPYIRVGGSNVTTYSAAGNFGTYLRTASSRFSGGTISISKIATIATAGALTVGVAARTERGTAATINFAANSISLIIEQLA